MLFSSPHDGSDALNNLLVAGRYWLSSWAISSHKKKNIYIILYYLSLWSPQIRNSAHLKKKCKNTINLSKALFNAFYTKYITTNIVICICLNSQCIVSKIFHIKICNLNRIWPLDLWQDYYIVYPTDPKGFIFQRVCTSKYVCMFSKCLTKII